MELNELMLLVLISIAVGTDLCDGKVYNRWIVTGVLCAGLLGFRDVLMGAAGWYLCVDRFVGMFLSVLVLMPVFSFGVIGGGDVKLFSMIGAFVGWKGVISCMVFSLLPTAVWAIVTMVYRGSLGRRFQQFRLYMQKVFLSGEVTVYETEHTKDGAICLSVPIMIGAWMYLQKLWVL